MARRRLSLLDTNFLVMETPQMPMHVAGLLIFEPSEEAGENFARDMVERFRRCKIVENPWNYRLKRPGRLQVLPLLEEVHDVDMEYHVRHLALPRPGGERELGQLIARLHSQRLDQTKPLWEVHVIEGLSEGRVAVYIKVHHAIADGHSMTIMLSRGLSRDPNDLESLPWWAQKADGISGSSALDFRPRKKASPAIRDVAEAVRQAARTWGIGAKRGDVTLTGAPRSILNSRLHSQRRVATCPIALDRLKAIAKGADCSLNDVVLTLSGTVLRDYLLARDALPKKSLTAMVPVSMHEAGSTSLENNISMIFANLGTNVADDGQRMETVKAASAAAKEQLRGLPEGTASTYTTTMLAPVIGQIVSPLSGRTRPMFNVTISNVRGPSEQTYLYGARLAHLYPVSVPFHGAGLNITCFSTAGCMNFGFTGCRDSLPHMQQMAVAMDEAVERLEALYVNQGKGQSKAAKAA